MVLHEGNEIKYWGQMSHFCIGAGGMGTRDIFPSNLWLIHPLRIPHSCTRIYTGILQNVDLGAPDTKVLIQ